MHVKALQLITSALFSPQGTHDVPVFFRKVVCVNPFIPLVIDFHGHTLTFSIFILLFGRDIHFGLSRLILSASVLVRR